METTAALLAFQDERHAVRFALNLPLGMRVIYQGKGFVGGLRENFFSLIDSCMSAPADASRRRHALIVRSDTSVPHVEGGDTCVLSDQLLHHTYVALQMRNGEIASSDGIAGNSIDDALRTFEGFKRKGAEEMFSFIAASDRTVSYYVKDGARRACHATCLETPNQDYIIDILGPAVIDCSTISALPEPAGGIASLFRKMFP